MKPHVVFAGKWVTAILAGYWLGFEPRVQQALITLIILMVVDFFTGVAAAAKEGKLASSEGFWGIGKKVSIIAFLLFCHFLEKSLGIELNLEFIGAIGYTFNEVVSVVENFALLGVPIPEILAIRLTKVKDLQPKYASKEQIQELINPVKMP